MKVLWFTNILIPEFARAIGLSANCYGGWLSALIDAMRQYAPSCKLIVAFSGMQYLERQINGVNYVCLGNVHTKEFLNNVYALLHTHKPDVVHLHGSEVIAQYLPTDLFQKWPVVLSIQGIISACGGAYLGGISAKELNSHSHFLRNLLHRSRSAQVAEYWLTILARREAYIFSQVKFVIGRTNFDNEWSRRLATQARYYHVDEILRSEFYEGNRDVNKITKHSIYCSAAMSYPLKGGHVLLKAISILKSKYPDIQLRVADAERVRPVHSVFAYLRQGDYHSYLCKMIKRLHLANNVTLLGSLSASEVVSELNSAELFCLPSFMENSPNSMCEAMLVGTPVIVSDVGGVSSMLQDGIDGICVGAGDVENLVEAIDFAFMNGDAMKKMAICAKVKSMRRHNPEHIAIRLLDVYKDIRS